jgi:molybdopterin-guanine dinucleotide biosynthesis protein A
LTGAHLVGIVQAFQRRPTVEVVVARTSEIEPTCAIWNTSVAPDVRRCFEQGERALHVVIRRLDSSEVDVDPTALRNINTPDELDRYP